MVDKVVTELQLIEAVRKLKPGQTMVIKLAAELKDSTDDDLVNYIKERSKRSPKFAEELAKLIKGV
jgi:hypothetical protein